ncbi:MAG: metallophosphoesterase [Chloroflexi bacterium]|nr:metallophosphoesterase [Chloroflexota bacterium]
MSTKDFSQNTRFPGTTSSPFDSAVRVARMVERLPLIVFAALLFALALIPSQLHLSNAFILWLFFLGDWLLMLLLPRAGKSFGPAKPPTLLLALGRLIPAALPFPWNWIAQVVGTALVIYGFWIEPHRIVVTRQTLASSKLPKDSPPLKVLHLGDLHVERVTDRERQLIETTKKLKPDVILFSGDFLNLSNIHDPVAWEHARQVLRELTAPLGTFIVTGSPPVDQPQVIKKLLNGLDHIRWLANERISINHHGESIDIVGITCTHNPRIDRVSLDDILHGDPDPFTILLYHTPDLAPDAAQQGVDLQLSGHTHGGQVRLPFFGAIYTSSLYGKRFEVGRHQLDNTTLYVSRGIGMEGEGAPRVRFLCPPEVTLWEISGDSKT